MSCQTSETICKYYGSSVGCSRDNNCWYSHNNPNSVEFCLYYDKDYPNACISGNRCRYRHQQYPINTISNQSSISTKYQQQRPVNINNIELFEDETKRKMKLIYGYIRLLESAFNDIRIPKSIHDIIMLYYFKAFWDFNTSHSMIKIENKMIINLYEHGTASAFCINSVSQGICIWKLRIIKLFGEILIGIMENPNIPKANEKFWRLCGGFAYWNGGAINTKSDNEGDLYKYQYSKYGIKYGQNDIISVHLNMDLYQLSFSVNGNNFGIIPYKLKKNSQYYLGVGLTTKDDSVQLIE